MTTDIQPHEAEGQLVTTTIGPDGVRWACTVCNETVYEREGRWIHFRAELNLPAEEPAATPTEWVVWCHLHRHYVLAVSDDIPPTWTTVPGEARTMTRAEAHALADGRDWLGHEATPWARAQGNP